MDPFCGGGFPESYYRITIASPLLSTLLTMGITFFSFLRGRCFSFYMPSDFANCFSLVFWIIWNNFMSRVVKHATKKKKHANKPSTQELRAGGLPHVWNQMALQGNQARLDIIHNIISKENIFLWGVRCFCLGFVIKFQIHQLAPAA